jgi:hypothetical protein
MVICSKFEIEDPHILGATLKKLAATAARPPGFVNLFVRDIKIHQISAVPLL